ncbi:MAG: 1-acyl-sn-glycerol-3-phosphate acyltransferase [Acholeplasmataceae bacterium]|nr:1-acyl-sn-glycerol-3-phosphate acyltransferase [Acholeplasmataceae bacterium]
MISAVFIVSFLAFSILMTFFAGPWTLFPLWLVLAYPIAFLMAFLALASTLPIMKRIRHDHPFKYYMTKSAAVFLNHLIMRLKITFHGLENIPESGRLTVYANHKSYADPFIILEMMPRPITFTPKMGVYKLFFIGKWLKYLNAFPIDRTSDRNTARAMVDAIKTVKDGMAMAIFPEGGIKDRDEELMVAMRAGAYKVATKAQSDLLPVRIKGTTEIKRRAPFRSTKISVTILPVISFESIKGMSTSDIAEMMFEQINRV